MTCLYYPEKNWLCLWVNFFQGKKVSLQRCEEHIPIDFWMHDIFGCWARIDMAVCLAITKLSAIPCMTSVSYRSVSWNIFQSQMGSWMTSHRLSEQQTLLSMIKAALPGVWYNLLSTLKGIFPYFFWPWRIDVLWKYKSGLSRIPVHGGSCSSLWQIGWIFGKCHLPCSSCLRHWLDEYNHPDQGRRLL